MVTKDLCAWKLQVLSKCTQFEEKQNNYQTLLCTSSMSMQVTMSCLLSASFVLLIHERRQERVSLWRYWVVPLLNCQPLSMTSLLDCSSSSSCTTNQAENAIIAQLQQKVRVLSIKVSSIQQNFEIEIPHMTSTAKPPQSWLWLVHITHHICEQGPCKKWMTDCCAHSDEGYSIVVATSVIFSFQFQVFVGLRKPWWIELLANKRIHFASAGTIWGRIQFEGSNLLIKYQNFLIQSLVYMYTKLWYCTKKYSSTS